MYSRHLETISLYYTVLCGFEILVERLIATRPDDVSLIGGYYWTPLHASLAKRYKNIAHLLLLHGANVNVLDDDDDKSSLQGASESRRCKVTARTPRRYQPIVGPHSGLRRAKENWKLR